MKRTPIKRVKKITAKRRTASEFNRIYGSKKRAEWVKSLPCCVCGAVTGDNHNHHTRNGGMSRKADAETIVSLCVYHHHALHDGVLGHISASCWQDVAASTERAWQKHQEAV